MVLILDQPGSGFYVYRLFLTEVKVPHGVLKQQVRLEKHVGGNKEFHGSFQDGE